MNKLKTIAVSLVSALLAVGCASLGKPSQAWSDLAARSASQASGTVSFAEVSGGLRVEAVVRGLTPGEHGFHIHEAGDCSAPDASSAKGHFNPAGTAHGHYAGSPRHAGDMPNLTADSRGEARYAATVPGLALRGPNGVVGRSVVVHADPDDYTSQPAGNSGARVACGVIAAR